MPHCANRGKETLESHILVALLMTAVGIAVCIYAVRGAWVAMVGNSEKYFIGESA